MSKPVSPFAGLGMTLQKPTELKEPGETDLGYSLDSLEPEHWMYKEIAIDFKNAGLKIHDIEYLNNHLFWQKYTNEKRAMEHRKPQDPAFEINEKYLYHGTVAEKDSICVEGLDQRLSKKGRFGKGIYFSDNPAKCVKYAEKKKRTPFILLERVILGSTKVYPDKETAPLLSREPEKTAPFKGWRFHDSVKGRPKDHIEYVVYRNDRALIECVITYSKAEDSGACAISKATDSSQSLSSSKYEIPRMDTHYRDDREMKPNTRVLSSSRQIGGLSADVDTSDEEDLTDLSDSDHEEGYSSDSSTERNPDGAHRISVERKFAQYATSVVTKKTGEDILSQKRDEFILHTGEIREHVIESLLSAAGLDVNKAVRLYLDKDKKKQLMEREQRQRSLLKNTSKVSADEDTERKQTVPPAPPDPATNPERWKQLPEEDKAAIIAAMMDNFLTITSLEDNGENRLLSRQILTHCDFNLDRSIVAYYESL